MATDKKADKVIKMKGLSSDVQEERLSALKNLLPEAFSEGRLDNEKLKTIFDTEALAGNEDGERFRLEWAGKGKVFDEIARRTSCTLALDEKRSSEDFQNSQNVFIEGENLEVLRMLQKAYHGKVKMIYIDPPYNTGHDFVYSDDFRQTEEEYNEDFCNLDENGNIKRAYTKNSKDSGRYHSNWLSMMYPRLYLARNLLKEDGVIFVSIDDNEVHNLKAVMNEIFGEENFVGTLIHQRAKGGGMAKNLVNSHDYIHVYAKNINLVSLKQKKIVQQKTVEINGEIYLINDDLYRRKFGGKIDKSAPHRCYFYEEIESAKGAAEKDFIDSQIAEGKYFLKKHKSGYHLVARYEKVSESFSKVYGIIKILSEEGKKETDDLLGEDIFDYPKPTQLIKFLIEISTSDSLGEQEVILDFFAGSGSTAHSVMAQNAIDGGNRQYICVQMPERTLEGSEARKAGYIKISDIAIDRIKKAAEKIRKEHPDYAGDFGVRVYRETDSNFPQWHSRSYGSDEELTSSLLEYAKRMPIGDEQARATEVLLKLGYSLTSSLEQKDGYLLVEGTLALVLSDTFKAKDLEKVFEVKPSTIVVLERIFADDSEKINFALKCKEEKVIFQTI